MRLTRSVTLDLPTDLLDPFEAAAIAKGISLNQAVEAAIKTLESSIWLATSPSSTKVSVALLGIWPRTMRRTVMP